MEQDVTKVEGERTERSEQPPEGAVIEGARATYHLQDIIGEGGMGVVWRCHCAKTNDWMALKIMNASFASDPDYVKRFMSEVQAVELLSGVKQVIHFFDHGMWGGRPYFVTVLLPGRDLNAVLRKRDRFPVREAEEIVSEVAKGLEAAHDMGFVHRDLKPQNIFMTPMNGHDFPVILDFGVAKMPWSEATKPGTILGSLSYMAPEQIRDASSVDRRADVYSLACILFRMVTGKPAVTRGDNFAATIYQICSEPRPAPSSIDPSLAYLDKFFAKAMHHDPQRRFESALHLTDAFRALTRAPSGSQPRFEQLTPSTVGASVCAGTDAAPRNVEEGEVPAVLAESLAPSEPVEPAAKDAPPQDVAAAATAALSEERPRGPIVQPGGIRTRQAAVLTVVLGASMLLAVTALLLLLPSGLHDPNHQIVTTAGVERPSGTNENSGGDEKPITMAQVSAKPEAQINKEAKPPLTPEEPDPGAAIADGEKGKDEKKPVKEAATGPTKVGGGPAGVSRSKDATSGQSPHRVSSSPPKKQAASSDEATVFHGDY